MQLSAALHGQGAVPEVPIKVEQSLGRLGRNPSPGKVGQVSIPWEGWAGIQLLGTDTVGL